MALANDPISQILELLSSCDMSVRDKGVKKLEKLSANGICSSVGIRLLEAAAQIKPCPDLIWPEEGSNRCVAALFEDPFPEYFPIIEKNFDAYGSDAKRYSLAMLTEEPSGEGLAVFWRIAESRLREPAFNWLPRTDTSLAERRDAAGLPLVESLAEDLPRAIFCSIGQISLEHLKMGWLAPTRLTVSAPGLFSRTRRAFARADSHQGAGHAWIWTEEYLDVRDELSICLDLLGFIESKEAREPLKLAKTSMNDPKLKYFGEMSLIRLGEPVDEIAINEIAKSAEMRGWLYRDLAEMNRENLVQPQWRTQEALAEAAIVCWLIYPTELGRVPDEIVELGRMELTVDGELRDVYVYRFRTFEPHWAAEDGWMVGWSGPFPRNGPPEWHGSDTFSEFEKWDESLPFDSFVEL